ncbi:copper-binding protein [Rhodoferax sp.]|uniref:copper-binding protein n=1 Tax=Rhodoferax sp. TaxID=50421 RepID=UPI0025FE6DAC|nr:copper-binding protein [Rhodoferax sp.]
MTFSQLAHRAGITLAALMCATSVLAQTSAGLAHGEIRKIDKAAAKITIKHGDIPSIEMPPMTMVFTVRDPALLDAAKAGDKVRFDVVQEGGKYIVTRLEAAP